MSWKVYMSPPEMSDVERSLLVAAFDSGWIAPAGPDLDAFEVELAEFTGASCAVGVSSGTAVLHLALLALDVGRGADVVMPTLTFAASAFAATYVGARPCFLDVDTTWQLDAELLDADLRAWSRRRRLPAAVIAVDLYGNVADMVEIAARCAHYGVPLIEDAAEAVGASLGGLAAGRFGALGVLSFNGNKIVTTGGGGAIVTDDAAIAARCRHLASQARQPVMHYEHNEIGYNYRLGNLNAAVGRGQLRTLPHRIAARARVRATYEESLGSVPGLSFQPHRDGCSRNHWLTTINVDPLAFGATAARLVEALHAAGIEARPGFKPMHRQPVFVGCAMTSNGRSDVLLENSVSLPSGGGLTGEDLAWICDVIVGEAR